MMNLEKAVELCRLVENFLHEHPEFNAHVGLTGGCLYKDGDRKDVDLILYPHKDEEEFDAWRIVTQMSRPEDGVEGWLYRKNYGRVIKATYNGSEVDILVPGAKGKYNVAETEDDEVAF